MILIQFKELGERNLLLLIPDEHMHNIASLQHGDSILSSGDGQLVVSSAIKWIKSEGIKFKIAEVEDELEVVSLHEVRGTEQ